MAPETRPLPAVSRAHPARDVRRGEEMIPRPVVRGPMGVALLRSRCPVPSPGRFGRATAGYFDRPQAAMGSRHQPGTVPGPAGDRPSPLRAPPPATQLHSHTRAKSRVSIETRELRLSSRECDFLDVSMTSSLDAVRPICWFHAPLYRCHQMTTE